jgi:ABC-type antimicrobial peptide transport system permease subunit
LKAVPLTYVVRNLWVRRVTTLLTATGMALVVFVFATVLMMSEGIRATLVATGQADNVVVLRKGAGSEINSGIARDQAAAVTTLPGLARGSVGAEDGVLLASREVVVLNNLPKRGSGQPSNVTMRGTGATGMALRPQVRVTEGRLFRPGSNEVIVGRAVARGFAGADLGGTLRFGGRDWTVVGVFDAGRSAFDSEIWLDAEQLMAAFRRQSFSTVLLRLAPGVPAATLLGAFEAELRLKQLDAIPEDRFYAAQSESLATFIRVLGLALAVIFSVGAVVGAMITMFGSVASRTAEIGTLRALGFRRRAILLAFLGESLALALAGGAVGLAAAGFMQAVDVSTTNFATFAELAFRFTLTPAIALQALGFALAMGVLGGFVPALRAARTKIVDSLRAA